MTDSEIMALGLEIQAQLRKELHPALTFIEVYTLRLVQAVEVQMLQDQDYKAKLGQVVIDFIDRMNDYEDPEEAQRLLQHFLANVEPILDGEFNRRRCSKGEQT
jgi:hypothetical protein